MSELKFVAEEIKLKVLRLLRESSVLENRCKELEGEKLNLQKQLHTQKIRNRELEESNKIVKLAGTLADSADDIPALKRKLNDYIREIDECIRFLSERQV